MIFLKACPKCHGALVLEDDIYGKYLACLSCGLARDVPETYDERAAALDRVRESEAA